MSDDNSNQTAYQYNAIGKSLTADEHDYGWCSTINALLQQRYAFLPQQYEDSGHLFRGMSNGFSAAVLNDRFEYFNDDSSVASFEQELDIVCVSQDFSDAYSVSRLWEHNPDACIAVIKASLFNAELHSRNAAILATAEPGVVFKYPFFTRSLTLEDIELIIVSPLFQSAVKTGCLHDVVQDLTAEQGTLMKRSIEALMLNNKLITCPETYQRSTLEQELTAMLDEQEIHGAGLIASNLIPKRT